MVGIISSNTWPSLSLILPSIFKKQSKAQLLMRSNAYDDGCGFTENKNF